MKTNIRDVKKQAPQEDYDNGISTDHLSFISNTNGLPSYHQRSK